MESTVFFRIFSQHSYLTTEKPEIHCHLLICPYIKSYFKYNFHLKCHTILIVNYQIWSHLNWVKSLVGSKKLSSGTEQAGKEKGKLFTAVWLRYGNKICPILSLGELKYLCRVKWSLMGNKLSWDTGVWICDLKEAIILKWMSKDLAFR